MMGQATLQGLRRSVAKEFQYQELRGSDIRLITIDPSDDDPDAEIRCTLTQRPLDSEPDYYALSYVWGDASEKQSIQVNGQLFKVTKNLYEALHHLREVYTRRHDNRPFWIDAICLNQNDDEEKSAQVPRMADIYTKCHRVVIWLGKNEEKFDKLFEELFAKASSHTSVTADNATLSLLLLGLRPWFHRIWTLQEACLGCRREIFDSEDRDPIMWSGDYSVRMEDLSDLSYELGKAQPENLQLSMNTTSLGFYQPILEDRKNARSAADFLLQVLLSLSGREASKPVDYLYGLLGLVGEDLCKELPESLRPNYQLEFEKVYQEYATYLLTQTQSLRLLNFSKSELKDVPSWVTDFRHLQRGGDIHNIPKTDLRINGNVLSVKGLEIGTCASHIPTFANMTKKPNASECLDRYTLIDEKIINQAAMYCRTNQDADGIREQFFADADISLTDYKDFISRLKTGGPDMKGKLRRAGDITLVSLAIKSWLVLADGTIMTTDHCEPNEGDLVCFFEGSEVPSIIRKVDETRYKFVAPASVVYSPQVTIDKSILEGARLTGFDLI